MSKTTTLGTLKNAFITSFSLDILDEQLYHRTTRIGLREDRQINPLPYLAQ